MQATIASVTQINGHFEYVTMGTAVGLCDDSIRIPEISKRSSGSPDTDGFVHERNE